MNEVSRETETPRKIAVLPLAMRADLRLATRQKLKKATRRIVVASNSKVQPGQFAGLDLDTGRARHEDPPQLRARRTFGSGNVRVVTVTPRVMKGDLFWVKTSRFSPRKASPLTLEVCSVGVSRVQDMTDQDAIEEGVEMVLIPKKRAPVVALTSPRERFAWLWNRINGAGVASWEANPWVWIYRYETYEENVDAFLARREGSK